MEGQGHFLKNILFFRTGRLISMKAIQRYQVSVYRTNGPLVQRCPQLEYILSSDFAMVGLYSVIFSDNSSVALFEICRNGLHFKGTMLKC